MPWELQATPSDSSSSLGSVEHVQSQLLAAVPNIELFRDASGPEKIKAMESSGIGVPDFIREHLMQRTGNYEGVLEGDGFTVEFDLGETESAVAAVGINVRGSGDPTEVIDRLIKIPGWKILDANSSPVRHQS